MRSNAPHLRLHLLPIVLFFNVFLPCHAQSTACSQCPSSGGQYPNTSALTFNPADTSLSITMPGGTTCKISKSDYPVAIVPQAAYQSDGSIGTYINVCTNASPDQSVTTTSLAIDDIQCLSKDSIINPGDGTYGFGIIGTVDLRQGRCTDAGTYNFWPLTITGVGGTPDSLWLEISGANIKVYYKSNNAAKSCNSNCYCGCLTASQIIAQCAIASGNDCALSSTECLTCSDFGTKLNVLDYLRRAAEPTYRPLSAYEGEIQEILLADILSSYNSPDHAFQRYKGIIAAFPKDVQFYFLVNFNDDVDPSITLRHFKDTIRPLFGDGRPDPFFLTTYDYCEIMKLGSGFLSGTNISCDESNSNVPYGWAQDPIAVAEDASGGRVLLTPNAVSSFTTFFFAQEVSLGTSLLEKKVALPFEGGNLLSDGRTLFVGADDLYDSMLSIYGHASDKLLRKMRKFYKRTFGVKDVVWVGDSTFSTVLTSDPNFPGGAYQPAYHLDLFMTLGGPFKEEGVEKELIFVGEQAIVSTGRLDTDSLRQYPTIHNMASSLDDVATQLSQTQINGRPVKVVRIPLPLVVSQSDAGSNLSGKYMSYNNCLVEATPFRKVVYIPDYPNSRLAGFKALVETAFSLSGYDVKWVEGHFIDTSMGGNYALHCMTKVLKRKKSRP